MSATKQEVIEALKKSQENFAVGIGVTFALLLSVYFFTYAMLTDKGYHGMLWFEAVTALLMVLALVRLKVVSFTIARFWLRRKVAYRSLLTTLTPTDLV